MNYELVRNIKESSKSKIDLVRKIDESSQDNGRAQKENLYIRKTLQGKHSVYALLLDNPHPYLPKLYEVNEADGCVTVIEEYIEGEPIGSMDLPKERLLQAAGELCDVLEFLHGKNIIHRDVKPSNILMAKDGHIRLIDFDAARMPKDELEQDTSLLGTRGYAPPEQYGFAQTDRRADIYALGVTLQKLLGSEADKPRYKKVIRKCTNLNPDKRYASAKQVKRELSCAKRNSLRIAAAVLLLCLAGLSAYLWAQAQKPKLIVLPAPANPHWKGESGIGEWGCVPESGRNGEETYAYMMFRIDEDREPDPENDTCYMQSGMSGNSITDDEMSMSSVSLVQNLEQNGYYYFTVRAMGDGIKYADSPYAVSDVFEYTGENAPPMPAPEGLYWNVGVSSNGGKSYYAAFTNLDDYKDEDTFSVRFYDESGNMIAKNEWSKREINMRGNSGIWFDDGRYATSGGTYRFAIEVYTSRPNEYSSLIFDGTVPEEAYSPWIKLEE